MFVLAFNNTNATIPNNPINNTANKVERNSHRKYFLPRVNITNVISNQLLIGVEHVPKEIKEFVGNKNIKANIFLVQVNNSVMCGHFCIGFIDFMLAGKKLTYFTNMFSPHEFKKNDIILTYFKDE